MNCNKVVLIGLVLALCQAQSCLSAGLFGLFGGPSPPVQINSYLNTKVSSSDDFRANLAEASKWLEQLNQKKHKVKKGSLQEALGIFVSLEKTLSVDSCGQEAYSTLLANENLAEKVNDGQPNKIREVLQQVKGEHAKVCENQYNAVYTREVAKVENTDLLAKVEMFLSNDFIHQTLEGLDFIEQVKHFAQLIKAGVFETFPRTLGKEKTPVANVARDVVTKYANKASDGAAAMKCLKKFKADECVPEVRKLLVKYLEEPCKYYVDTLGPRVFLAHQYDLGNMGDLHENDGEADLDLAQLGEYELAWARFNYCRFGITGKSAIQTDNDLVRNVLASWTAEFAPKSGEVEDEEEENV